MCSRHNALYALPLVSTYSYLSATSYGLSTPPAHVQRAHSLGAVQLVSADGQQVDLGGVDVHRHLAHSLQSRGTEHGVKGVGGQRGAQQRPFAASPHA